jgi:hypothetical protein
MCGVQHHVREEEEEMLPRAERQLGNSLEQLGMQMQQRKQELLAAMPTTGQAGQGTLAQRKTAVDKNSGGSSTIEQSIDVYVPVHVAYNQWTQFEECAIDPQQARGAIQRGNKGKEYRHV